jgi:hypothetical protein
MITIHQAIDRIALISQMMAYMWAFSRLVGLAAHRAVG